MGRDRGGIVVGNLLAKTILLEKKTGNLKTWRAFSWLLADVKKTLRVEVSSNNNLFLKSVIQFV